MKVVKHSNSQGTLDEAIYLASIYHYGQVQEDGVTLMVFIGSIYLCPLYWELLGLNLS
jgi:hypothetical protein